MTRQTTEPKVSPVPKLSPDDTLGTGDTLGTSDLTREAFGVYVHVPFCTRRCDYCAFATWTDRWHLVDEYVSACRSQASTESLVPATSVFFGGGTPSLLAAEQLGAILDAIPRSSNAEVTVECNPETVTPRLLAGYRSAGVTRLSFGVQSWIPHVLASLGRQHDRASVTAAVAAAADNGFGDSYSVDLIYGAVGETVADWQATLEAVCSLDPSPAHVSAYALTPEPGTPLGKDLARHPDDDDQADKYLLADRTLASVGLEWYELSNWARPGRECRHNQLYWAQGAYQGIGAAAHSHKPGSAGSGSLRWWNLRTPDRYISAVAAGESVVAVEDAIDTETRDLEALQLALRTRRGVPAAALQDAIAAEPDLEELVEPEGHAEKGGAGPGADPRLVLTTRGRLLANEVAMRLKSVGSQDG